MERREAGGNPLTAAAARLVAGISSGVVDAVLDVSLRAASSYGDKEEEEAAPRRSPEWWNSPEPRTRRRSRRGRR